MEYAENKKTVKKSPHWKREEIIGFLHEYDECKDETRVTTFCRDRQLSCTTFRSWLKKRRNGEYSSKGRFIQLPPLAVPPQVPSVSEELFASISIHGIQVKLHQYVDPAYLQVLLTKITVK